MKKLSKILLAIVGFAVVFTSCDDNDDDNNNAPSGTPESTATIITLDTLLDEDGEVVKLIQTYNDRGEGTGTVTWSPTTMIGGVSVPNEIILDGRVFVNDGQTLTIEPGTIVKARSGQGINASALIVARGGMIDAEGTADKPIIFTSAADEVDDEFKSSLPATTRGLWGGVILLGKASLNSTGNETAIEGIPTSETRGLYGGTNDADNSGTLKYVSIRFGGTEIGAGNEINGLSLGGVGSGTTMDYIEIIGNKDDAIEFYGGTATVKHLVCAYQGDDGIDYDEGWRGKIQFAFVIFADDETGHGGEHDGGTDPEDGTPYAHPVIANVTSIAGQAGQRAVYFRDNAGGEYHNSLFYGYDEGIIVEYRNDRASSYDRYMGGILKIANCHFDKVVTNIAANTDSIFSLDAGAGSVTAAMEAQLDSSFAANGNANGASTLSYNKWVLDAGVTSGTSFDITNDPFFTSTDYIGAFAPGATTNWMTTGNWSYLAKTMN